ELDDHEYVGSGIGHRGYFAQAAQVGDLSGDRLRGGVGIGVRDHHQREQTGLALADDVAVHAHARVTDTLHHRPHQAPAPRTSSAPESPESPESVTSPESASLPGASSAPARAAPPATGSNAGCTMPTGSPCPRTGTRSQSHSPSTPRARSAPASS